MQNLIGKYSRHTVWLYALAAVALGIGGAYATHGLGPKVTAGVYAAIVGGAGFASTFTTRARTRGAVAAFLLAGLAAAAIYYVLVSSVFAAATTAATDAVSGGDAHAHAEGAKAASVFGRFFGAFAAIIAFLETTIVGITGAVAGSAAKQQAGGARGPAGALAQRA